MHEPGNDVARRPRVTGPWRKPSFSDPTNCVEVAPTEDGGVAMRDTKDNGQGPVLFFTRGEMRAFLLGAQAREFDDLVS